MSTGASFRPRTAGLLLLVALSTAGIRRTQGPSRVHPLWPNEPPELSLVADESWDRIGDPWTLLWGTATLATDSAAPGSPPSVLRIEFPAGFIGGAAPGTEALTLPRARAVYVGLWWKASDPWQGHPSNCNKIQYLFAAPHGSMSMMLYGTPGGPYELRVFPDWHGEWLRPNVAEVPVTLGRWHRIEWLVTTDPARPAPNGVVRWWLDGVLIGDHARVRLAGGPFIEYRVAPVWGGAEAVPKRATDYFLYDHTRVSAR